MYLSGTWPCSFFKHEHTVYVSFLSCIDHTWYGFWVLFSNMSILCMSHSCLVLTIHDMVSGSCILPKIEVADTAENGAGEITPLRLPNVEMIVTLRLCWASYGAPTLWMIPSLFLFASQWLVALTQCEDDILPMFWCWNLPVRTSNYFQSCICSHASFWAS